MHCQSRGHYLTNYSISYHSPVSSLTFKAEVGTYCRIMYANVVCVIISSTKLHQRKNSLIPFYTPKNYKHTAKHLKCECLKCATKALKIFQLTARKCTNEDLKAPILLSNSTMRHNKLFNVIADLWLQHCVYRTRTINARCRHTKAF